MSTTLEIAPHNRSNPVLELLGIDSRRHQSTQTVSSSSAGDAGGYCIPGPLVCYVCRSPFPDKAAVLVHCHADQGQPNSDMCLCQQCQTPITAEKEGLPDDSEDDDDIPGPEYAVSPEGGLFDKLSYLADDHEIWEDNLPAFMGKLEPGTLSDSNGMKMWKLARCTQPELLKGPNGQTMVSRSTGRPMRDISLPKHIPHDVSGWRLGYYERKFLEQGINLQLGDIIDRMSRPMELRALSMRLQRQREAMGLLARHPKEKTTFACKQNMQTIENLTVFQAKLNTVWMPSHISPHGPWKVVQPQYHPHYTKTTLQTTNYQGSSYIEMMYGLSDRVRDISDTMIYLDCLAWEANLEPCAETRSQLWQTTDVEEFEHWRSCMDRGASIADVRRALKNATTVQQWQGALDGDELMIASLQTAKTQMQLPH